MQIHCGAEIWTRVSLRLLVPYHRLRIARAAESTIDSKVFEIRFTMAASSSDWDEAVAYWSRVGALGMEAALREAGCSQQRIVETLSSVNSDTTCNLDTLYSFTDPALGRAVVLATLGRDNDSRLEVVSYPSGRNRFWSMSINEAAALSVNLSSNNKIKYLELVRVKVFGTVEGCTLLGNALAANSVLETLQLNEVGMGSDSVRCLLHGLQSNKTLTQLYLVLNLLQDEGISCVANFLSNNATIEVLYLSDTGCSLEGAKQMSSALLSNTTLKTLCLREEAFGGESMNTLLQPLSLDAMNSTIPKNTTLKTLWLIPPNWVCVESVSHMIRTNKSLETLRIPSSKFLRKDWTERIFPALKENATLLTLDLNGCDGLDGEGVYESLMDLLQNSNTKLGEIDILGTALESRQGQINEELRINKEYRTQLKGQPQEAITSGRIVLCGYGFAGKTEICKTMKRIEHGTLYAHLVKMMWKKLMQSYPALQRSLLGRDAHKELTARTRGFEVVVLKNQPYVKAIWDFAGQKEYYALHDYVFPDVKNSYFLYVCSCRLPPDDSDLKGKIKSESHIKVECEFWLKFLASNSKRDGGSHGRQLPRVSFVLTKTDTLSSSDSGQMISIAKHVVHELKGAFKDVLNLCEVVEVVNGCSSREVKRLLTTSNKNLAEILKNQREYAICKQVRDLLEDWSTSNLLKPVLSLDDFCKLCQEKLQSRSKKLSEDGWKIVLIALNDLGEIIFSKHTDFIVTNPSWFGIDVLGSLINAFKAADHNQTRVSQWRGAFCSRVEIPELYHSHGFVERQDIAQHLDRSLQTMDLKESIKVEQLIDLMIHLEMCFPNHDDDAEAKDPSLFMPCLFDDDNETAAKGKRQLAWKVEQRGPFEYLGRRLECQDKVTTFLTPGFFPRLQVHLRNYIHEREWTKNYGFGVERNLIRFSVSGVEVCVEYAGDHDYFIDILVRSSEPFAKAKEFVEKHVVETIRTFCASPQGCQGVDLAESVIRPVCVRDLHLCMDRKEHSVLVSELKKRLAADNAYKHTWTKRIGYQFGTQRALDLLEGEGTGKAQVGPVPYRSSAAVSSSAYVLPRLIYPTIEDVGILRQWEAHLNLSKIITVKLHLLCDHKDGSHKVEGQPGRTVKLNASAGGVDVPIIKLAVTLLWAGVGVGASMVGASVVVPHVDKFIESLFTVPEMPGLDGETIHKMMNPSYAPEPVSEQEILKALERYWEVDPNTQGLKDILKLDDNKKFKTDFQLHKVEYTEAAHVNKIGWVCVKHYNEGLAEGILRSLPH